MIEKSRKFKKFFYLLFVREGNKIFVVQSLHKPRTAGSSTSFLSVDSTRNFGFTIPYTGFDKPCCDYRLEVRSNNQILILLKKCIFDD